jgi:hypothetical protein
MPWEGRLQLFTVSFVGIAGGGVARSQPLSTANSAARPSLHSLPEGYWDTLHSSTLSQLKPA